MVISDHLNLTGMSPLLGRNADDLGDRFPDLTDVWSPAHRAALKAAGAAEGVDLEEGVYAGLLGPHYETPAEVRMLRALGADAVGMSTVVEAIAARWVGLEVCGVSLVTNPGAGYTGQPLTHEEVMAAGAEAGPRLARVLRRFIAEPRPGLSASRGTLASRLAPAGVVPRGPVEEHAQQQDPEEDAEEQHQRVHEPRPRRPGDRGQAGDGGGDDERDDADRGDGLLGLTR